MNRIGMTAMYHRNARSNFEAAFVACPKRKAERRMQMVKECEQLAIKSTGRQRALALEKMEILLRGVKLAVKDWEERVAWLEKRRGRH